MLQEVSECVVPFTQRIVNYDIAHPVISSEERDLYWTGVSERFLVASLLGMTSEQY